MISPTDKHRLTDQHFASPTSLARGVLEGEYSSDCAFFSRPHLWLQLCSNSYGVHFTEDELIPVPGGSDHSEHDITDNDATPAKKQQQLTILDAPEILTIINMDVGRLLLDPIFQTSAVKQDITQILYNYNRYTPYKQGFHEICAVVYLELHREAEHDPALREAIKINTFNIFTSMMITIVPQFYNSDNLVGWCVSVFNKYLRLIDAPLYNLLIKSHRIESQVWLIRWVRLIFLRELQEDNTLKLWDLMLSYDSDFSKLVPFIIVVMLIKLKLRLVDCEDNGEILYLLLHYPHTPMTNDDVRLIIGWSIQLCECPEDSLHVLGLKITKKIHKDQKWDKVKDLDKLKLEFKLQRRVRGALKRS